MGVTPRRVAAAGLLSGVGLGLAGLVALWVLIPVLGAILTLALGGAVVAVSLRALVNSR